MKKRIENKKAENKTKFLAASYSENIRFTLSDSGKYYIVSGFDGAPTPELSIPPTYKKKPVLSFARQAFCGIGEIKTLFIPESITEISGSRFEGCFGIEKIEVDSNNPVYYSANNCIIERESKKLILGCKNSIIPADNSIEAIDAYAFKHCSELKEITIPSSVKVIQNGAFYGCSGLSSIARESDNPTYYSVDNCLIEKNRKVLVLGCKNSKIPSDGRAKIIGNGAFAGVKELVSIDIPPCITGINMDAFYNCSGLEEISIPYSVIAICGGAFYGCKKLTRITYNGTREEWLKLKKGKLWDFGTPEYTVFCLDGNVKKKSKKD